MSREKTVYRKLQRASIQIIAENRSEILKAAKALDAFKKFDLESYKKVKKYLRYIFISSKVKKYNYTSVANQAWIVGGDMFSKNIDNSYLASLIIHEAHHIAQYKKSLPYMGRDAEKQALDKQIQFLKIVDYPEAIEFLQKQLKEKWWVQLREKDKTHDRAAKAFFKYLSDSGIKPKEPSY